MFKKPLPISKIKINFCSSFLCLFIFLWGWGCLFFITFFLKICVQNLAKSRFGQLSSLGLLYKKMNKSLIELEQRL